MPAEKELGRVSGWAWPKVRSTAVAGRFNYGWKETQFEYLKPAFPRVISRVASLWRGDWAEGFSLEVAVVVVVVE